MSKIMELRNKRNALWEQTKNFLEDHRDENGFVDAASVEQYEKMGNDVRALGAEIARLEEQEAFEAELAKPTSRPVMGAP
ncbi:MAG: phage major capsid protein, partial [Lachnospiraceae bacterium]|nr:phage major capsid protein [Lachnospiraceae bacterium]